MNAVADTPLKVLVAEDEPKLASILDRALTGQGHEVVCVYRGDDAYHAAKGDGFDAIVLDLMLPGMDGVAVCERLRGEGVTSSIIMLTARSSVNDRIDGLDAGADDYLTKPFALRELYARMRAVQRRGRTADTAPRREPIEAAGISLLPDEHACERNGQLIDLRVKEYRILEYLMRHVGQVVTRDEILEAGWEEEVDHRSNAIDAQIMRLRSKIDRPFGLTSLETLRGIGFRLRDVTGSE